MTLVSVSSVGVPFTFTETSDISSTGYLAE